MDWHQLWHPFRTFSPRMANREIALAVKSYRNAVFIALTSVLTACASEPKEPPLVVAHVVDNSCKAFGKISWSVNDTPETATEVRQHNARYNRLCQKK